MSVSVSRAMNQYKQVGTRVNADSADSHQLIVMLFDGVLERIALAKGAMDRKDVAEKGHKIGRAIAIIDGLIAALDKTQGGAIAENLEGLYYYMQRRLLEANAENNPVLLDEVADLMKEVRSAWTAIPLEERLVTAGE